MPSLSANHDAQKTDELLSNARRAGFVHEMQTSSTPGSPPPSGPFHARLARRNAGAEEVLSHDARSITSRDIITLWVARMVLAGLYNMGEVPFHEVYITPKILDGYGETMSKSKGNGVDPLDVIEKFGADALRFGIAYLTTDTQDVKMPVEFECPHCQAQFAADEEEPPAAADRMREVRQAVQHAMGREAGGQGAARGRRGERAVRAGPQLRQQAVERGPLFADQPGRLYSRRLAGRGDRTTCCSKTAGCSRAWRR